MIADESRLSTHRFEDPEEVFETLVRHQREIKVQYRNYNEFVYENLETLPKGMTEHEVYLF